MALPSLKFTIDANQNLTINDGFVLPKFTVLVGKNNSGKSWLLKSINQKLQVGSEPYSVYYVSPERFGALERNTNLEDASFSNTFARDQEKLKNQSGDFITEAISKFNGLIAQLNRSPKKTKKIREIFLKNLNNKIPSIVFSYTNSTESTPFHFKINDKYINPNSDKFSSGTNQIIALMTSVMYFLYSNKYAKDAVLLLDEPDVHIHSDLQSEFVSFLVDVTKNTKHKIVIATHSSSIISGFVNLNNAYIGIRDNASFKIDFYKIDSYVRNLLPSLGSHSLSHTFNKSPILLVEGEDDELVWQHAVRNSGKDKLIKFHIINTESKNEMKKYEKLISNIASKLFDSPTVYEIRDGDNSSGVLNDIDFIKRSKLNCNEIENLILSNEVLAELGYATYSEALLKLKNGYTTCRFQNNANHTSSCKVCKVVTDLSNDSFNRFTAELKDSENTILPILKPENRLSWEVLVGKAIGKNISQKTTLTSIEGSIYNMLGEKISSWIG
jgi:predicted ATP-dependent endonuclease of OLD family